MLITVDEAHVLSQRFVDLPIVFLKDMTIKNPVGKELEIKSMARYNSDLTNFLKESSIESIEVIFTEALYTKLISINPLKYRKPYSTTKSFIEIDKLLNEIKEANKRSKRNRYLISCTEQYSKDKNGNIVPIFKFGEYITYERWQEIKGRIDKKKNIFFRYSENGIIVFVDLRQGGDDFVSRFQKNTDLVTSLVGRKSTDKITISPDFIGSSDVVSVDDPSKLLTEYTEGNMKLIILGDTPSKEYMDALQQVKNYDRYARYIMAINIDLRKKEDFILKVREAYNTDKWQTD